MFLNLDRRSHQGRSFKNEDLQGADFSRSDIRSADFTGANLEGANFTYAKAGLQPSWAIAIFLLAALLSVIAGAAAAIEGYIPIRYILPSPSQEDYFLASVANILTSLAILKITLHQGLQKALMTVVASVAIAIPVIGILSALGNDNSKLTDWFRGFQLTVFIEATTQGTDRPIAVVIIGFFIAVAATTAAIIALALAVVLATIVTSPRVSNLAIAGAGTLAVIVAAITTKNRARYLCPKYFPPQIKESGILELLQILAVLSAVAIAVAVVYSIGKVALATIVPEPIVSSLAFAGAGIYAVIVYAITNQNLLESFCPQKHQDIKVLVVPPRQIILSQSLQILAVISAVAIAATIVYLSSKIARQVLAEDPQYNLIRQIGIFLGAIGGTSFRDANLTDANFSNATLKSSNFQIANTTRTFWWQARELNYARVDDTILIDPKVRDLLVSGDGEGKNYEGANLRGANLNSAHLKDANLRTADLTEASLHAACLDGANLTEVQVISANFTWAQMTGVSLENWNIDSSTQLDDVESRYVYLLEHPKPGTDDRERRPSSGEFAPGDFTSLFQEVLNTVDLIFRDGIDWRAFMSSFKQLQVENEGTELYIQGIENKGEGVIVVKVAVPPETSKARIHHEFMQIYEQSIKSLEEKYKLKLEGKEALIKRFREHNASLKRILEYVATHPMPFPKNPIISDRLVVIDLGPGNCAQGFIAVKAQIWSDGHSLPKNFPGKLPPQPEIPRLYQEWQGKHEHLRRLHENQGLKSRIKKKPGQVSQLSDRDMPDVKRDMKKLAKELEKQLDSWLNSEAFYPIQKKLRSQFNPEDRVRVIVQSEDSQLRRLPWHLWDFFQEYRSAEVALSLPEGNRIKKSVPDREKIRILAVMGDDEGIDVEKDRELLQSLPDAESVFLVKPDRASLDSSLWDDRGWDILCFSGHSTSKTDGNSGRFQLGDRDIKLEELEKALIYAIGRGLQLAIFNSCDGLGLARQLENLHIPQIIVMREPVPNPVAQAFLNNLLQAYASGKTLYVAVREAREKLQGLEDEFPCATWLPVICQNPAEFTKTWQELRGTVKPKFPELLEQLKAAIETEPGLTAEDKEQALEQVNMLASVGANPQKVAQRKQLNTAKWLLQGIIASLPAATQMSEALDNLLFYLSMNNHDM
ncbi:MAG: pentapeptide repeat-containing protein [Hormoscilla sp.]